MGKWKRYQARELEGMKPGTVFRHATLGVCIIMSERALGYKYMHFKSGFPDSWFKLDTAPWDEQMLLLHLA